MIEDYFCYLLKLALIGEFDSKQSLHQYALHSGRFDEYVEIPEERRNEVNFRIKLLELISEFPIKGNGEP